MEKIKPRITLQGYNRATREYGEEPYRIVEELVANSYDADATEVAITYSGRHIAVIDNGTGIQDAQFPKLLDLGAGTKLGFSDSKRKRTYLGSFGFGIKSTLNIAKTIKILTINKTGRLATEIEKEVFKDRGFDDDWDGFPIERSNKNKSSSTGTIVSLELESDLTDEKIHSIERCLCNLPKAKDFRVYLSSKKKAGRVLGNATLDSITNLQREVKKLKKERIAGNLEIGPPKISKCILPGSDTIEIAVWCDGLDANMKVKNLGMLAGVYVKVDGRVLKRNFQGEKVLDGISKYPKFKHGMRIEVPIDWLKEQISLGRDGLQFSNEASQRKFENELKTAVSHAVKPYAKMLETRKNRAAVKELDFRMRKARERIRERQSIKDLERTGYCYVPHDDYEMALLIANPMVLRKICPTWVLMDFNGKLDFDCLVYNKANSEYIKVELEPELERFADQALLDNTDFVVTWTRGDWKVGKIKKGKRGYFELTENKDGLGHYKLLVRSGPKAKEIKKVLPVFCIDKTIR